MKTNDFQIEQALRISHCSHADRDNGHACAGECKITAHGIELSCVLCGSDKRPLISSVEEKAERRVTEILRAAGLDYSKLAPLTQRAVLNAVAKDFCPGCGAAHVHAAYSDYIDCGCGWKYSRYNGWKRSLAKSFPVNSDEVAF